MFNSIELCYEIMFIYNIVTGANQDNCLPYPNKAWTNFFIEFGGIEYLIDLLNNYIFKTRLMELEGKDKTPKLAYYTFILTCRVYIYIYYLFQNRFYIYYFPLNIII